jgi:hypothetical protein
MQKEVHKVITKNDDKPYSHKGKASLNNLIVIKSNTHNKKVTTHMLFTLVMW